MASQPVDTLALNKTLAPQDGGSIGVWLHTLTHRIGGRGVVRLQAGLELALAFGLIQIVLWPLAESRARVPVCCALAAMCVYSVWRTRRQFLADFTPRRSSSFSWAITTGATILLAILLIALGWAMGILRSDELLRLPTRQWSDWLGVKLPTVAVQQMLLQWFFLPLVLNIVAGTNCRSKAHRGGAVLICGVVFALVHLPNMVLVLLTFAAGSAWCALYLVHRRIAPLVVSHLLLAILAVNVGHVYVLNMSVGSRCVPLLPRTVRLADGGVLRAVPSVVAGHIDLCQPRGETMSVHGWIVDVRPSAIPDELIVCVNGELQAVPILRPRTSRPDVARVLNDPSIEQCGFVVDLPIESFDAENEVRILGRSTDGIFSELNFGENSRPPGP